MLADILDDFRRADFKTRFQVRSPRYDYVPRIGVHAWLSTWRYFPVCMHTRTHACSSYPLPAAAFPRKQENSIFTRGEFKMILKSSGGQCLNSKELQRIRKEFREESSKFDDMEIGDFGDTYLNVTNKPHFSFLWVSTFGRKRRPTVLFFDNDVPISLKYFIRVVRSQTRRVRSTFLHGSVVLKDGVFRFDGVSAPKWSVLRSEVPWRFYQTYAN